MNHYLVNFSWALSPSSSPSYPKPYAQKHFQLADSLRAHSNSLLYMAQSHRRPQTHQAEVPYILVLGPPFVLPYLQSNYSDKFGFLHSVGSPLTLDQFLAIEHIDPSSIRGLLCSPSFPIKHDVLQLLQSLGFIFTFSAGFDHIDLHECQCRGIKVAGTGNLYAKDVADMAVGLLIDVIRKISAADRYARQLTQYNHWNFPLTSKVGGKKIGIIGLGRIGSEVAKRLEGLGCMVLYYSRKQKPNVSYTYYANVVELAAASDALVACCSLNEETRHMINKEVMLALGKGVIVNVGRGALIDEKELVRFLVEEKIGGAGLDVFENEPHVPQELYGLNNVVLSPHAAAITSEAFVGMCELAIGNLEAFFSNKSLLTPVNGG